jgi:hypothetical protein
MIEMSWAQVREPELSEVLNRLIREKVEYKTALKMLTIVKGLEKEQKKAQDMFKIICDKHMELTEDKSRWVTKKGQEKEADAALKEFHTTKVKFKIPKIQSVELEHLKVTAVDLALLEPMLALDGEESHLAAVPEQQLDA